MGTEATALPLERPNSYQAIFWGGLIAGILDISAACIHANLVGGLSPMRVLQYVASGLLGADSYNGGLRSASLGLALHFLIAYVACAVFYAASRKFTFLVRQAFVWGPVYGIAVYAFMYLVVTPLTFNTSFFARKPSSIAVGLMIHILCIGLPIALVVRRFSNIRES
jgi:hypothetical protein